MPVVLCAIQYVHTDRMIKECQKTDPKCIRMDKQQEMNTAKTEDDPQSAILQLTITSESKRYEKNPQRK